MAQDRPHYPKRAGYCLVNQNGLRLHRESGFAAQKRRGGGKRSEVRGFSPKARKRMMSRLMELDWQQLSMPTPKGREGRAFFVTLTYGEHFEDLVKCKADLAAFRKRLQRAWGPKVAAVWKLENQLARAKREHWGFVPHYHLCVYLGGDLVSWREFTRWARAAWREVVKHRARVNVITVYGGGSGQLMGYLSKYMAKELPEEVETGRIWGEFGDLPEAPARVVKVTDMEALFRRIRRARRESEFLRGLGCSTVHPTKMSSADIRVYGGSAEQLLRGLGREGVTRLTVPGMLPGYI